MPNIDNPNENTDDSDNLGQHVSKIVQFAFQGRFLRDLRRDGFVDVSHRCFLASKDYDRGSISIHDSSTLWQSEN